MSIKEIVTTIKSNIDLIKAEGTSDTFKMELVFLERFPKLYDNYPFLVKKIISGENMEMLEKMLNSINSINKGSDKYKEEVKLGQILEKKYIKKDDKKEKA
tara:strand:- start:2082 stop:2384 length:303 start_codon:yes stop_codon:yes gene_type:complete